MYSRPFSTLPYLRCTTILLDRIKYDATCICTCNYTMSSHSYFLFSAEAFISRGDEEYFSTESDESDDEYDSSKGGLCFSVVKVSNFGLCEMKWPVWLLLHKFIGQPYPYT